MTYTPHAWYWFVGGDRSQAWSSAAGAFVATTDAAFAAWMAAGNLPTPIASAAELLAVLQAQAPSCAVSGLMSLAELQAAATTTLTAACDAAITGGFSAAALGGAYTYPSAATDQANLAQTAAAAGGGLLMCESAAGVWALVAHSQAQAQAVLAAFIAWRDKQRQQLATLIASVEAATTPAAVAAVLWP